LIPSAHPDAFVAAAIWTGFAALVLTLLLGLQIVAMRMLLRQRRRGERLPFLRLWAHLQGSLRGEANEALNEVARRLGIDAHARGLLGRGSRPARLLSALVLGHLRDRDAWPGLLRMAGQPDNTVALTALWALVRIDPQAASDYMVPLFIAREEWALSLAAGILQQAPEPAARALARLLPQLGQDKLPRALRIAEALHLTAAALRPGGSGRSGLPAAGAGGDEAGAGAAAPAGKGRIRPSLPPLRRTQARRQRGQFSWQARRPARAAAGPGTRFLRLARLCRHRPARLALTAHLPSSPATATRID
jgi:HEAT repeat protein